MIDCYTINYIEDILKVKPQKRNCIRETPGILLFNNSNFDMVVSKRIKVAKVMFTVNGPKMDTEPAYLHKHHPKHHHYGNAVIKGYMWSI